MVDIRPNALPDAILPLRSGDAVIVDQGADGVRQTDPISMTDSVAPVATQPEAIAGTDNVKRMTALRTKQSIASEVGVTLASNTQGAKADSAVQSVNGKSGNSITLDKSDVGLGNVDNTSDANKPVSTAQQAALDLKANATITISAGTGMTGGGDLSANRTVSLNSTSITSLAKADSSIQPGDNRLIPSGGSAGQVLGYGDGTTREWTNAGTGDMSASVYDPSSQGSNAFNGFPVATRTVMKAINVSQFNCLYLIEEGREGTFVLKAGSPPVADAQEGVYVVSDTSGYYWERVFGAGQAPDITAFGAKQDGVIDDTAAIQGSLDVLGFANVLEWKGAQIKVNTIRLKNYGDCLQGFGWPRLVTGTGAACTIENSFQTFRGFQVEGTLQTLGTPAVQLRTDLRGMTTVNISEHYLINCGAGVMDINSGTNKAVFVNIRDITMEGHRGYGIATWDCWASYHIDQVVVDRVGKSGADYNYPAFYFYGAEGIFFRNCAHNGSAATSLQTLQDGAVFDNCNFVVFENFIPDHSGGRGMAFLQCANVKGSDTTLVNCGGHGFVASGGSIFDLNSMTATQFASGSVNSDGFNIDTVLGFRARGLYATGFKRNGFLGNVLTRANIQGEFSNNASWGIVTLGSGVVNLFHGCITTGNTAGNYSISSSTDYLREHIVDAGTIGDATGPATA